MDALTRDREISSKIMAVERQIASFAKRDLSPSEERTRQALYGEKKGLISESLENWVEVQKHHDTIRFLRKSQHTHDQLVEIAGLLGVSIARIPAQIELLLSNREMLSTYLTRTPHDLPSQAGHTR